MMYSQTLRLFAKRAQLVLLLGISLASGELPFALANDNPLLFPNSDFEAGNLSGWKTEGEAFRYQPTQGDNPSARGRESSAHQGRFWVGGFERYSGRDGKPGDIFSDDSVGQLISPEFTIEKPFITFLIGGGYHPGKTGVKLLCDGQEIDLGTGANSETMSARSTDVSTLIGKQAKLVVYDDIEGDWGHINVDSFCAADKPIPGSTGEFALVEGIPSEVDSKCAYDEPLRPQFHFSATKNWLNDPNGMVFDGTQYHLFFQHNPLAPVWGNMTWGHATSPDMIHWQQHDHALLPYRVNQREGTIYSGTAVVDHDNSLGMQQSEQKTLCAFFTFASHPKFYQAMAYSTDGGGNWKYWNDGRPVIENQGLDAEERDPKVFWHAPSQHWVMALWVQRHPGKVRFFISTDLVSWEHASDLDRDWAFECMDLVFLPVIGDEQTTKAVLYDASFDYEIGTFDGREFHTEFGPHQAGGGNFYAAQTFANNRNNRAVQIGWMRGGPNSASTYGLPFNQQMSFPCELTVRLSGNELRLFVWPIEEIATITETSTVRHDLTLREGENLLSETPLLDLVDLEIDFAPGSAKRVEIQVAGAFLSYDTEAQRLMQRSTNEQGEPTEVVVFDKLAPQNGEVQLRFLIDRLSVESFAFDGERFFAAYFSPRHGNDSQSIHAVGGSAQVSRLKISNLKSAWQPNQ